VKIVECFSGVGVDYFGPVCAGCDYCVSAVVGHVVCLSFGWVLLLLIFCRVLVCLSMSSGVFLGFFVITFFVVVWDIVGCDRVVWFWVCFVCVAVCACLGGLGVGLGWLCGCVFFVACVGLVWLSLFCSTG
jgi:hypothetical protein